MDGGTSVREGLSVDVSGDGAVARGSERTGDEGWACKAGSRAYLIWLLTQTPGSKPSMFAYIWRIDYALSARDAADDQHSITHYDKTKHTAPHHTHHRPCQYYLASPLTWSGCRRHC
jgi:hypothetical protein